MRTLTSFLVSAATATVIATPAAAQHGSLGFGAGMVASRQVRDWAPNSETRRGLLLGLYIDPPTPVRWLSVLAEVSYVQRGGSYRLPRPVVSGANGFVKLNVETEYLAFVVAPTLNVPFGPVSLFGYAGPASDVHIRTRSASTLRAMLARTSTQTFAAVAGAGFEVRTPGGRTLRIEVRTNRGLSAAYSPDDGDIRYRSTEFIVRVGKQLLR